VDPAPQRRIVPGTCALQLDAEAAVDGDDAAGHVARGRRGEQQQRAVELVVPAGAAQRDALDRSSNRTSSIRLIRRGFTPSNSPETPGLHHLSVRTWG